MAGKKDARHRCNDSRANVHSTRDADSIAREYERGTLAWGIAFAIAVGMMAIHWAVTPWT